MITSLSLIFLAGLIGAFICNKIRLPRIIGMLLVGIILGPYVLNLIDSSILGISSDLRRIALIIILIKAGLSLDLTELKKVGRPAVLMSFLPAAAEIAAVVFFAPKILNITFTEAAIIGAVLGAVSPAVVVPRMVQLMDEGYGTDKQIPQMILAGASLDDVFVIVLFSAFIGMAGGEKVTVMKFAEIPVSIILGILAGTVIGFILSLIFERAHKKGKSIRQSIKVIVLLGAAFGLNSIETLLEGKVAFSSLLAVMAMAMTVGIKCRQEVKTDLSQKYGKLWTGAEILLFVLVGAAVDIRYTVSAGAGAVLIIVIALVFRSMAVLISIAGTKLNGKEKLYCVFAYLPKATVQAAIGSVALSMGLECGSIVLCVAVLSILITAPVGAIAMDLSYKKLLKPNK